jgi:hypothetical protein
MVQIINKEKVDYLNFHGWIEVWNGSAYRYINTSVDRYQDYSLDEAFRLQLERDN